MLESIQNDEVLFQELTPEEKESRGILGRLTGPIASFSKSTRNGRKYSESLWDKAFNNDIVKEMFKNGGLIGQLEHPEGTVESDPLKACIIMREPPKKDKKGHLIASVDILNTPCGQIAYALSKAGFKYGISSRGEGDVEEGFNGESVVNPDTYELTTFDLVALPACEEARLVFTESIDKPKFDYKKYLKESYECSDDERKAVLSAECEKLGINIFESKESLEKDSNDKDILTEEDPYDDEITDLDDNTDADVVYPFTITFRTNDDKLMVGIIEGSDKAEALRLFDEYCPGCEIENVRNGKIVGDYPDITPEFKTTVLGIEPESDELVDDVNMNESLNESFNDKPSINYINQAIRGVDLLFRNLHELGAATKANELLKLKIETNLDKALESINLGESLDINEAHEDIEADNNGDILAELQESMLTNSKLEKEISSLNEKLSVCYAKETNYKNTISESKSIEQKLKISNEKVINLKDKLNETKETLSESRKTIVDLKKQIDSLEKSISDSKSKSVTLSESVKSESDKAKVLAENIQKIQRKHKKEMDKVVKTCQELTESYNKLKDDYSLKEVNFQKKIENDKKLVEKYKKVANTAVDKYVELQAKAIGVSSEMIKQKLPESYSFTDIDSAVKDLQDYTLSVSRLPFSASRLNENIKMEVKSSNNDSLTKLVENNDDVVDDSLLRMAGLR